MFDLVILIKFKGRRLMKKFIIKIVVFVVGVVVVVVFVFVD